MNKLLILLVSVLLISGCEFRPDTNGVYMKAEKARPVKCAQESAYRVRCYSYGEPTSLKQER